VRNRPIPLAVYTPKVSDLKGFSIVILNHGYNFNEPEAYLGYSFLGEALAKRWRSVGEALAKRWRSVGEKRLFCNPYSA
jgi:hypothetical protein